MIRIVILLCFLYIEQVNAATINIDLTKKNIDISNNFKGTELFLYGTKNGPGDIVVLIRGPKLSYIVRKKEQLAKLWIANTQLKIVSAYNYYYAASNNVFKLIANNNLLRHLEIGSNNIYLKTEGDTSGPIAEELKKQFITHQQSQKLYLDNEKGVKYINDKLFRVNIPIPYNVSPGIYIVEAFLINNGELVTMEATPFYVNRAGFNGFIFKIAYQQPLIYAIIAIIVPLIAGVMVSMIFNRTASYKLNNKEK